MNKMIAAVAALGVMAGAVSAQSTAQKFDYTPYNYSFRIGVGFPNDGALKANQDNWTNIGVDYNFNTSILRNGDSYLSVDWVTEEFSDYDNSMVTIFLNNRFYMDETSQIYLIGGIGAVIAEFTAGKETIFGGRFGVGYNLGQNIFLTGTYTFAGKVDGINPSHTSINIGYRF